MLGHGIKIIFSFSDIEIEKLLFHLIFIMKIREEKNGNFWIFCIGMMLWYFMSGIEYGIILANINDYLLKGFGSVHLIVL